MTTTRLRAATLLTATALLLAGCATAHAPDAPAPTASATLPLPPGLTTDRSPAPAPDASCDATASLRPPATMPTPGKMPRGSSMQRIVDHGRLIVGLDIGSNLFSFRDPTSGSIEGFDVDIAHEIARAIFNDPNRIEFRILDSGERVEALQTGQVDMVVKTMSITCDRRSEVAFSTVYYEASQRILVPRNSGINVASNLANKRVCFARGTTSIARIQRLVPSATILTAANWADCLVVLQQGQADAISTDDAILAGMAAQDPNLEVVGPSLGTEPYGIGINAADRQLLSFTNGVLAEIRADGRWTTIYNRWLEPSLGPSYPPTASYSS